jgi:hypothetical protein
VTYRDATGTGYVGHIGTFDRGSVESKKVKAAWNNYATANPGWMGAGFRPASWPREQSLVFNPVTETPTTWGIITDSGEFWRVWAFQQAGMVPYTYRCSAIQEANRQAGIEHIFRGDPELDYAENTLTIVGKWISCTALKGMHTRSKLLQDVDRKLQAYARTQTRTALLALGTAFVKWRVGESSEYRKPERNKENVITILEQYLNDHHAI